MRYAIVADIHGNLEALETAREYIAKHDLTRVVCLGDSIGYGANPNECLQWVFAHAELHVLGNHEAAVIHEKVRLHFNDYARVAIDWTAERLDPGLVCKIKELPFLQISDPMTLAHGTVHSPERFDYMFDLPDAHRSFLAMKARVAFVGHSHIPCFFTEREPACGRLSEGVLKLKDGERYILNPGSIGQPRDRDPRLSLGVFDADELTFEIVRLPYDNKKAAQKIRAEGLPRLLADRLL
jgi:predicted phosphodiesterase